MDNEKSKFSFWKTLMVAILVGWPWVYMVMQAYRALSADGVYELTARELANIHIPAIIGSILMGVLMYLYIKRKEKRNQ